jgi:hypothetical protein
MGTQTDMKPPEIPLHEIVAQGILLALVVVLGWRVIEYRNEQRAVTRLLEQKRQSETRDRGENAIDED